MSYRAGYTPEERRRIEEGLFRGDLIRITSTNALELGVDVEILMHPSLPAIQAPSPARGSRPAERVAAPDYSLTILVALDGPLDQYLMRHPDYFFGGVHERGIVDPGNRRILDGHLQCAAYRSPLTQGDLELFDSAAVDVLASLEESGRLIRRSEKWYYRGD